MTKSSNGTEKRTDAAQPAETRGWFVERGGYLGATTGEKLPKAPPLVSGETTLADAMPSTSGSK